MNEALNSPLELQCGLSIPNRLCKSAMTEGLADEWGRPTSKLCNLYERWSKGGSGLLVTGNIQVDRRYVERPGNVCIDGYQGDEQLSCLKSLAVSAKKYGSVVIAQISHGGRQSNGMINLHPVGPGNIRLNLPKTHFGTPSALTITEIVDIKQRFVYAASICKQCGFDGVQIHSAHGYLLSSFLNPNANNRPQLFPNDPYGGNIENRSRLLIEIIRAIRNEVGPKFAISVKLNSADFQEGGFTTEEAIKVSELLENEDIDLLEISGGNYESGIYKETVIDANKDKKQKSTQIREAYFLEYALEVKRNLKKTPILVTGGWRSASNMSRAIREGDCAMIGLGRPLCGDPDGSRKILDGTIEELPRYEDTLVVFVWCLQWLFWIPLKLLQILNMVCKQSWYYRNIVSIAETGNANPSLGCFRSFISNMKHESFLATNMKGDVQCVGSHYKGPVNKNKEGKKED